MLGEVRLFPNNSFAVIRSPGGIVGYETIPPELQAAYSLFIAFGEAARTEKEVSDEQAYQFIKNNATSEEKLEMVLSYPLWTPEEDYIIGDEFQFADQLYRVIQAHSSQMDWLPNVATALYRKVNPPGFIAEWIQPTGAHDAYNIGEHVMFKTKEYSSLITANAWSPTDSPTSWQLISVLVEPPVEPIIPNWVQPTGAQDAYVVGARVMFEGRVYESKIAANVWSPTGYPAGWLLIP